MPGKSFYFLNLGCPKNQTDGDYARGALTDLGLSEADYPDDVDYIFINTCAFIEQARLETRGEVEQLLPYKKNGAQLIALGCYPALTDIKTEIPGIDAAFRFDQLADVIEYVSGRKDYCYVPKTTDRVIDGFPYAYVNISDGCDNRCSYCTIPQIRGRYRSRPVEKLIEEIDYLALNGVKEVVLVAQDSAIYGRDLNPKINLPGLCEKVAAIDGIEWIRIMYAHPAHLDEAILNRLYAIDKVCRYLDMPIQHISDNILTRMRRHCDSGQIRRLINHLRKLDKNISLRTTLMVGFPGETDDDYRQLVEFVEQSEFDHLGVFSYSPEMNTTAYSLDNRIDPELAEERCELLYEIASEASQNRAAGWIGQSQVLLVDSGVRDSDGFYEARSFGQAPEVDSIYGVESGVELKMGQFIKAEIIDSDKARFSELITGEV
jgi:ribosomal protein S12 methylthiotransferase